MSYRRPLSFKSNEKDLLDAFDSNGGSNFAKEAMRFFLKYKDKVITDGMVELFKMMNGTKVIQEETKETSNENKSKLGKLIR